MGLTGCPPATDWRKSRRCESRAAKERSLSVPIVEGNKEKKLKQNKQKPKIEHTDKKNQCSGSGSHLHRRFLASGSSDLILF